MSRWISLYWTWLLPALATLATLVRLRYYSLARRREMITRRGWRWILVGLAAAQCLLWLAQAAVVYSTNPWLPIGGLIAVGLMVASVRVGRDEAHPALRSFRYTLPQDGLLLLERRGTGHQAPRAAVLLLPAWSLILYIAASVATTYSERWLDFAVLALAQFAPWLVIPSRRQWMALLLLALPMVVLLNQALSLRKTLPAGSWATPISGAGCQGQIDVAGNLAWCANGFTAVVYQFDFSSGVVTMASYVEEGARLFAANAERGWIQQNPARGLVVVAADTGATTAVRVPSAHTGAADSLNRLWVIDVGNELSLYVGDHVTRLRARDGLLNNTANIVKVSPAGDVWVGSAEGASRLPAGQTEWQTLGREIGFPGRVINFAFASDGAVWLLWQARSGRFSWGVSVASADGLWRHREVGSQIQLETPVAEDALAVDGYGRLWFVTQSILKREKFLGVLDPADDATMDLYSLGHFDVSGPYRYGGGLWQDSFGVASDGAGGIILFNGDSLWRHWRP